MTEFRHPKLRVVQMLADIPPAPFGQYREYLDVRAHALHCPAHRDGKCSHDYDPDGLGCQVWTCARCLRLMPWCCGGGGDGDDGLEEFCDDCWCAIMKERGEL